MDDVSRKLEELTSNPEAFLKGFASYLNDPQRAMEDEAARAQMVPLVELGTKLIGAPYESADDDEKWWFSAANHGDWSMQLNYGLPGQCQLMCLIKEDGTEADMEAIYAMVGYCTIHDIYVHVMKG